MTQVCSVFSQLLQLFSRGEFSRAVKQHSAERNAKGFTCWGQFVAMLFCQVAQLRSLREVCMGLASCEAPLKHLGLSETPKKSTLAYANENRPWELYQTVFGQLLEKCQAEVAARGGRRKFRFKNKLVSLDGSIIDLSAAMFDWAKYRRTKGAIKLHLLLDHHGYLPSFAVVTEGKHSEVAIARSLRLEPGTILVIDRGYNDYDWFAEMTREGVFFVTRMKTNTVYTVEEECAVPANGNVLRDQIISLPALRKAAEEPVLFRRIEYWNQDKQEILVFFTNLLHLAAPTIAAIYKERWQVELFFKALKQTLKVKTFLGTSANAVKTQIWTALIAMLILKYLQMKSTFGWSLSNLAALLRQQLFIFRDLWAWLNDPLQGPPAARRLGEQLAMPVMW
ncbi:MAG: IS4 family transposase [Planctomycetaceae bacterium]|nr:MAG: IS4 family transposase [Planctomycetaceae bacterium]